MTDRLNIAANRQDRKWTRREQVGRVLWRLAEPFFRFSPRPVWAWRRFLLRSFGATIGREVHVYPSARITIPWNLDLGDGCAVGERAILYALGPITIGPRSTVSQYAHLCAGSHDWRDPAVSLTKPPIAIGSDVWIAADAFVGPGVTIGDGAILGARAVVMKDCTPWAVMVGNPAKQVATRQLSNLEGEGAAETKVEGAYVDH